MWKMVQCAIQGSGHIRAGIPCQDKTCVNYENDVHVVALADGAGSAFFSHHGAEAVVKYVCESLPNVFEQYFNEEDGRQIKSHLMDGILGALTSLASELPCEIKELASTLLFVAVKQNRFVIAHIGDGVIGYRKNDQLFIASSPQNGEFANSTIFTTSPSALASMKLIKGNLGATDGFVLMSDGTEAGFYHKQEKKLADILKKILHMSSIIQTNRMQYLLEENFKNLLPSRTSDDCSIALLANDRSFNGYFHCTESEKCKLLEIVPGTKNYKKRLERFDSILEYLQEPRSETEIARFIYLKKKYIQKYTNKLLQLHFVERRDMKYVTTVIMDH